MDGKSYGSPYFIMDIGRLEGLKMFKKLFYWIDKLLGIQDDFYDDLDEYDEINTHQIMLGILMQKAIKEVDSIED